MSSSRKEPYSTARRRKIYDAAVQGPSEAILGGHVVPTASEQPSSQVDASRSASIAPLKEEEHQALPIDYTELLNPTPLDEIMEAMGDLAHIESALISGMLSFSVSRKNLQFIQKPSLDTMYQRRGLGDSTPSNSGLFALDPRVAVNREFILYESWLYATYWSLHALPTGLSPEVDDLRGRLLEQVSSERERLEDVKELDWDAQTKDAHLLYSVSPENEVSTVETDRFYEHILASRSVTDAPIFACSVVAATMNLLYSVPLSTTAVLLAGLRSVTRLTLQYARESSTLPREDERLLRFISRDPRTILNAFKLDPCVTSYICCPKCFALYPNVGDSPTTCSYRSTKTSESCESRLVRTRTVDQKQITYPIRVYLHQSLKHWLGRLLSRPDIEVHLERAAASQPASPMRDIFDAMALRNLLGPDRKTPFLQAPGDELRLIFSLSADSFNPYQMKEAKKKVSSTAMYMVCLNLPPHLRYLPENVFLVGVVPGPTKPSMEQMNHFLAPLVDELMDLWDTGVWYSRTSRMVSGRRARAAMVPLVCDLLAARQVAGLGQHNHSFMMCSFCGTAQDDIDNTDPSTFPPRDLVAHREAATAWLYADSTHERELLFSKTGIRYTELLRLPYWNPILYVVVDTMHNLYLGLLQRHIRDIWGINVDADDGEAIGRHGGKGPPRPSDEAMAGGLDALLYGDEKALRRCKKAVVYHLCADRDLRRAGTIAQLTKILHQWRSKEGLPTKRPAGPTRSPIEDPSEQSTADPLQDVLQPDGTSNTRPPAADELSAAIRSLCNAKKAATLKRFRKPVLVAVCETCQLQPNGSKTEITERLLSWRDSSGSHLETLRERLAVIGTQQQPELIEAKASAHSTHLGHLSVAMEPKVSHQESPPGSIGAIGRSTLAAFVEDRSRMELPVWVNRAPAAFGTTQHGKLSADQWRTVGTINLPVTLIRTWGTELPDIDEGSRSAGQRNEASESISGDATVEPDDASDVLPAGSPAGSEETLHMRLLRNFLDLVDAVETIGLLEVDEEQIERAEDALERYLQGLKELYQHAKIQPNHHLALHIGMFLRLFGPVHAWRAFAFERFNFMLQSIKASKNLGQMEVTFMMHSCRAANIRPLLRTEAVQSMMREFVEAHDRQSGEDRRGMRFDDMFRSIRDAPPRADPGKTPKRIKLQYPLLSALAKLLNADPGTVKYSASAISRMAGQLLLSMNAIQCSKVAISGVFYKPTRLAPGDGNVMVQTLPASAPQPARIDHIVLHTRTTYDGTTVEETFIFVHFLLPLSSKDQKKDPYRKFPGIGGSLYYDAYDDDVVAIRPKDIVSHFAKTRMDHLVVKMCLVDDVGNKSVSNVTFAKQCVHVRPLDRLHRNAHHAEVANMEEIDDEEAL